MVVTVCDTESENCPIWLGGAKQAYRAFDDPFSAKGTEQEQIALYRRVLSDIEQHIPALLNEFSE